MGDVDFLILDLPPGTGDIQLTIVQTAELDGVVVVTTPQEVALIDTRKAIGLFERVETPILGVIENMSYFQCPSDGKIYHIFGEGGGEREAAKLGVPLLGKIPLDIATRFGGDEGRPVALEDPGQNPVPPRSARWLNNAPVWCLTAECPGGAGGPGPVDTLNLEAGLEPAAPVRLVCRHVPAP